MIKFYTLDETKVIKILVILNKRKHKISHLF